MRHNHLPFDPTLHLRNELIQKYLCPAFDWLVDVQDETNPSVLPVKLGSVWETAYVIITLLLSKRLIEKTTGFSGKYSRKIAASIDFLLDKVREDTNTANWDGGLYDTAIAIRALILFSINQPESNANKRIMNLVEKGMIWICLEVEGWESERYSLGIADLAQVLQTVILWEDTKHTSLKEYLKKKDIKLPLPNLEFDKYILDQLFNTVSGYSERKYGEKTQLTSDYIPSSAQEQPRPDVWNIGEALIGLVNYYQKNQMDVKNNPTLLGKIANIIQHSVRLLETEHVDGNWGLPDSTSIALLAYIRGHTIWDDLDPEPQIVFKTVRWLCDEKQRFSDGSILHDTADTIFFCLAVKEVCEQWITENSRLDVSVIDLYDYIIWLLPSRTSAERAKRLDVQGKLERTELLLQSNIITLENTKKSLKKWKLFFFIITWTVIGIILNALFGFLKITNISITSIRIPTFDISMWQEFLALTSIWLSVGIFWGQKILRAKNSIIANDNSDYQIE